MTSTPPTPRPARNRGRTEATVTPNPQRSTPYVTAWDAQSRTHAHVVYTVRYDRLENAFSCECPGYTYNGHCAHIEACMVALVGEWQKKKRRAA